MRLLASGFSTVNCVLTKETHFNCALMTSTHTYQVLMEWSVPSFLALAPGCNKLYFTGINLGGFTEENSKSALYIKHNYFVLAAPTIFEYSIRISF